MATDPERHLHHSGLLSCDTRAEEISLKMKIWDVSAKISGCQKETGDWQFSSDRFIQNTFLPSRYHFSSAFVFDVVSWLLMSQPLLGLKPCKTLSNSSLFSLILVPEKQASARAI